MFRWCERCFGHFKRCVIVAVLSDCQSNWMWCCFCSCGIENEWKIWLRVVEKSSCFIGITLCFSANTHVIGLSSSFIEKSWRLFVIEKFSCSDWKIYLFSKFLSSYRNLLFLMENIYMHWIFDYSIKMVLPSW